LTEARGATPAEWFHFDFELGLAGNLLPCVPAAADVQVLEGSALEGKVGKIPSQFNAAGFAHGLKDWQKRKILDNELALWRKDQRLNICVRTGAISGVYAIDVDIEDVEIGSRARTLIEAVVGAGTVWRVRSNSGKFLFPFRMESGECKKRLIKLGPKPKDPRIELLADGQQFVAAGSHSSGARYQWSPGLPSEFPRLSPQQLDQLWAVLSTTFGMPGDTKATPTSSSPTDSSTSTSLSEQDFTLQCALSETDWNDLCSALKSLLDKVPTNDDWSEIGYSLLSIQKTRPARQLWIEFSKKAVGYEGDDAPEKWWDAHCNQTPRSDYRHVFTIARSHGWGKQSSPDSFAPVQQTPTGSDSGAEISVDPLPPPERPVIQVADAALVENLAQLEQVLQPIVYAQGSQLTRVSQDYLDDGIIRDLLADLPHLISVNVAQVRVESMKLADFARFVKPIGKPRNDSPNAGTWARCSCPPELAGTFLDMGQWRRLRPLNAIARSPFVRPDGSICDMSGYDALARALYIPAIEYPPIPAEPDEQMASDALERLLAPFAEFPFQTAAARSAFAVHILTEAARIALPTSPAFWYTAPNAGTGKSLLSVMPSLIVHGNEPAMRPWVVDGEELRKTLFASLLAGDRSIAFDNVPNGYKARAPELCAFLTSAVWQDRKLGASEVHAIPNRAVVSASGNNVTPVADLARRSLVVRLDANSRSMKQRRFKIGNLRAYVLEHRANLLVDALTILKAYALAPKLDVTPLPSYEPWSKLCREAVMWLGMVDPCESQAETDDETESLDVVFELLAKHFADNPFGSMDIAKVIGGITDAEGDLSSALMQSGCGEPNNALKVGYWLREQRDKIASNYKMVAAGRGRQGIRWRLMRVEANEDLA
jgi:hypothetical protein